MHNLITVSGPRGAGKEAVVNAILSSKDGANLHRVVPFTTRKKREGETDGKEYFFISMEEYSVMMNHEAILYSVHIGTSGDHYFSGTLKSEFEKCENGIIDITVEGARTLAPLAERSLMLYVYASAEERCERIMKRQNLRRREALMFMINEPSPAYSVDDAKERYADFTILFNHDAARPQSLLDPVHEFLGALVHA